MFYQYTCFQVFYKIPNTKVDAANLSVSKRTDVVKLMGPLGVLVIPLPRFRGLIVREP